MSERYIFGIDLGGTTAKLGLFTAQGELLAKCEVPTDTRENGKNILPNLAASIREQTRINWLREGDIAGVGLGIPGPVCKGWVGVCANLNGWGDFSAPDAFSHLCGLPVRAVNDANAAALGELWQGSAKGARNMVLVTLGTGVGGGVVVDGHIVEGSHGAGGEIGHIQVRMDETRPCGCGKHGCLEQYASATGLVYAAQALLNSTAEPSLLRQCPAVTAKSIFACVKQGDALAKRVTQNAASALGRALSMISCVCDPEVIVLGGGVSRAGTYLLNAVQAAFEEHALPAMQATAFRLAALGNDAGMYGAARLMAEQRFP